MPSRPIMFVMGSEHNKRITYFLEHEKHSKLKNFAKSLNISISELIRRIISKKVGDENKASKKASDVSRIENKRRFDLQLNIRDYQLISKLSDKFGFSKSSFIRLLINNSILNNFDKWAEDTNSIGNRHENGSSDSMRCFFTTFEEESRDVLYKSKGMAEEYEGDKKIRITCFIDIGIYEKLAVISKKEKISVSGLIRLLIASLRSTPTESIKEWAETNNTKNKKRIDLRLNTEDYNFISVTSEEYGVSKSGYIRTLVNSFLVKNNNIKTTLSHSTHNPSIINKSEDAPEKLFERSLEFFLLQSDVESRNTFDRLVTNYNDYVEANSLFKMRVALLKAHLNCAYDLVDHFEKKILDGSKNIYSRDLLSVVLLKYFIARNKYSARDDINGATKVLLEIIDMVGSNKYQTLLSACYVLLGKIYICKLDYESAKMFYEKAFKYLEDSPLINRNLVEVPETGYLSFVNNDVKKADELLSTFKLENVQEYSVMRFAFVSSYKMYSLVCLGKYDLAHEYRKEVLELEPYISITKSFSLFGLYIDSLKDEKALFALKKIVKNASRKKILKNYIYQSAMYVQDNKHYKKQGKEGLEDICEKGDYPLIVKAAEETLKTKTLQPTR